MALPWQDYMQPELYGYTQQSKDMAGYPRMPQYATPAQMQQEEDNYNPYGGLIKAGAAANYNFKGKNIQPMQDLASVITQLSRAQVNPDDPLYQRIYESERSSNMQDLSSAIAEMSRQNRKLSMMGRTPLFNPERGGEMAFRQMTQGYQSAQDQARARARDIIGAGRQGYQGAYNAQAAIAGEQDQNQKRKAFGFGNIADALPIVLGMLK